MRPLDYPEHDPSDYVAWWWNGKPWPAADRRVMYLSKTQTDSLTGYALFTDNIIDAMTSADKAEVVDFVCRNEELRPTIYHGLMITTVGAMRRITGYDP